MNKAKLKSYAPAARRDFIQAVTQRANLLGLSATAVAPVQITGDIALINGRPWPAKVAQQRELLVARIKRQGFDAVMEAEAYGWFNRFAALRFMELHGYLDHGYRVLSSHTGVLPEILENAASLDRSTLPGLDRDEVIRLKLDGDKDNELYRLLLTTQCNALASSMGFLFEKLGDETELLLPDNLLNTDSVIAKMVTSIDEADWQQVEIIGWLYQFYITEKKDEVIGKVVKSEDIPAATQLFTPNWIVKYLTQNSIGRLWLMANPKSGLKAQMDYYIEPAEQTPEVQAQLDVLIQTRIAEDGGSLNPETITVLDPACGSGHILVEAYDILKEIYLERGYQPRAIPRLILEKNLFGLDIDDRAAQMAGFALLMKARADDRRLFDDAINLNVMALQDSHGVDDATLATTVFDAAIALEGGDALFSAQLFGGDQLATQHSSGLKPEDLRELIQFFADAKTFGSLLTVPISLAAKLPKLATLLEQVSEKSNKLAQAYAVEIRKCFLKPAETLAQQYDAVVANPPYMGGSYFNEKLLNFTSNAYLGWAGDLYTCFIKKSLDSLKPAGTASLITIGTWLFLPTYAGMRHDILAGNTFLSIIDNGRGVWGSDHASIMVSIQSCGIVDYRISVKNLSVGMGQVQHIDAIRDKFIALLPSSIDQNTYKSATGCVVSVGVSDRFMNLLSTVRKLSDLASVRQGIKTGKIEKFVKFWFEVDQSNIYINCDSQLASKTSTKKWYPCNKGGEFKKWYGNLDYVMNWQFDGNEIKNFKDDNGKLRSRPQNIQFFFKEGLTWSTVAMGKPSFRYSARGRVFESGGSTVFIDDSSEIYFVLGVINSKLGALAVRVLSPKVSLGEGAVSKFPVPKILGLIKDEIAENARALVQIFRDIEGETEQSPNFLKLPAWEIREKSIGDCFSACENQAALRLIDIEEKEARNDSLVASEIGESWDSIQRGHWKDYGVSQLEKGSFSRRLLSFSIGCMMGRYSLDELGLIYAHAGNAGFDPTRYKTFPADADGIVPVTDELWFDDDAANRVREFLLAVWGAETLDENIAWLADSLGRKGGQSAEETIRSYISGSYFKDHLKTYKKRPIYWLFSSGKQKAFECLVYLHRYNEGTLARMRNEYVIPLAGKFDGRAELLDNLITAASTTSERSKLQKELDTLKKKQLELNQFDEQLRHYADQRITLDLDDGVKVNYGKFGNLLAEVKAITGGAADD